MRGSSTSAVESIDPTASVALFTGPDQERGWDDAGQLARRCTRAGFGEGLQQLIHPEARSVQGGEDLGDGSGLVEDLLAVEIPRPGADLLIGTGDP